MYNLLKFIDNFELDKVGATFEFISLHTRNKEKAVYQCIDFFKTYDEIRGQYYFYTASSDYCYKAGYCYKLNKSKDGIYWLILQNKDFYFEC